MPINMSTKAIAYQLHCSKNNISDNAGDTFKEDSPRDFAKKAAKKQTPIFSDEAEVS